MTNPNVTTVANSETIPGKGYSIRSYRRKGDPETFLFLNNQVNYDYLDLMGLELVSGRFFSKDHKLDSNAVILNEAAVAAMGFEDPIGQSLTSAFKKGRTLTVIGVVKNYNVESLHKDIAPASLEFDENINGYLSIKLSSSHSIRETLLFVEDVWIKHTNNKPLQYFFFDEDYQQIYESETTTGRILLIFSSLSVFIACLGLIGLISFTTMVRRKELGIRKVLGAGTMALVRLLTSDVLRLIMVATLIAWPLAYFGSNYWLANFADRIEVGFWVYMISTMALISIVAIAIGFQTIKASMNNPVESLRQD